MYPVGKQFQITHEKSSVFLHVFNDNMIIIFVYMYFQNISR